MKKQQTTRAIKLEAVGPRRVPEYIKRLCNVSRDEFARKAGMSINHMRKKVSSGQAFQIHEAVRIADASNGAISCEDLRGDVDWAEFKRAVSRLRVDGDASA